MPTLPTLYERAWKDDMPLLKWERIALADMVIALQQSHGYDVGHLLLDMADGKAAETPYAFYRRKITNQRTN